MLIRVKLIKMLCNICVITLSAVRMPINAWDTLLNYTSQRQLRPLSPNLVKKLNPYANSAQSI